MTGRLDCKHGSLEKTMVSNLTPIQWNEVYGPYNFLKTAIKLVLILFAVLFSIHSNAEITYEIRQQDQPGVAPGVVYPALTVLAALNPPRGSVARSNPNVLQDNEVNELRSAAEQGDPIAMTNFALYLKAGIGIDQNKEEAAVWCRKAAEMGLAGAQTNLGDMYENGSGVPKSYGDAIYWYTKAAMSGEPTAYLSLGDMFAKGFGVQKDLVESYFWYTMAIKHLSGKGHLRAAKLNRNTIEKTMTETEISNANKKANNFIPLTQTEYPVGDPPQE